MIFKKIFLNTKECGRLSSRTQELFKKEKKTENLDTLEAAGYFLCIFFFIHHLSSLGRDNKIYKKCF
ncbi:MAG: hypothetical protein D3915_09900 [Candidatus Electrothrix sp. AU1_5]|nr:hypothetical protein [Candidatus Electrothrix gigas]MCI5226175.1 hypothetical protein [Candidatus Electrothrix gigas]